MRVDATATLEISGELLMERPVARGKVGGRTDDLEHNDNTTSLGRHCEALNKFYIADGIGAVEEMKRRLLEIIGSTLILQ